MRVAHPAELALEAPHPDVTQLLPLGLLAVFTPGFLLARGRHAHEVTRDRLWRLIYWVGVFTLPVLLASAPIRAAAPPSSWRPAA